MTSLLAPRTPASRSGLTGRSENVGSPRRDRLVLVLELLIALPTRAPGGTIDDLIADLDVTRRTFYRLIGHMRAAGISIESHHLPDGHAAYFLGDRSRGQGILAKLDGPPPAEPWKKLVAAAECRAREAAAAKERAEKAEAATRTEAAATLVAAAARAKAHCRSCLQAQMAILTAEERRTVTTDGGVLRQVVALKWARFTCRRLP